MYVLLMVLLMGLVIKKLVDFGGFFGLPKAARLLTAMILGIVGAYLFDLDLFAALGLHIRSGMGLVATGLAFGATAGVWHDVLSWLESHNRKVVDEAIQLETAHPKAA